MSNTTKNKVITIRLNDKQYNFLKEWQKELEQQLHLEIPMSALLRRLINIIDPQDIKRRSKSEEDAQLTIDIIKKLLLNYQDSSKDN